MIKSRRHLEVPCHNEWLRIIILEFVSLQLIVTLIAHFLSIKNILRINSKLAAACRQSRFQSYHTKWFFFKVAYRFPLKKIRNILKFKPACSTLKYIDFFCLLVFCCALSFLFGGEAVADYTSIINLSISLWWAFIVARFHQVRSHIDCWRWSSPPHFSSSSLC